MRLALEIIDGKNRGQQFILRSGLVLGRGVAGDKSTGDNKSTEVANPKALFFADTEMLNSHAVITYDLNNTWIINSLAPAKIRLGSSEVEQATLILGLVFHLGQTGLKVVERVAKTSSSGQPWQEALKKWLIEFSARPTSTELFFFLKPIRLSFTQGPQYEEVYTLSYGPRELGYNSLDINTKDPATPPRIAKFFQIGEQAYIENLCGNAATINGAPFDQHTIKSGDILKVASNTIELSILT